MEHDGAGVGVVPQVEQLVGGVPVVGVDRSEGPLECAVHRLDVLRAVVQVLSDRLLTFEPGVEQVLRDAISSSVDFGPRTAVIAMDQAEGVGQLIGHDFPDVGKVPVPHPAVRTTPHAIPASQAHLDR